MADPSRQHANKMSLLFSMHTCTIILYALHLELVLEDFCYIVHTFLLLDSMKLLSHATQLQHVVSNQHLIVERPYCSMAFIRVVFISFVTIVSEVAGSELTDKHFIGMCENCIAVVRLAL